MPERPRCLSLPNSAISARPSPHTPAGPREDAAASAARGQAGLLARFGREVREAQPGLSEVEYERRAQSAYEAHMGRLALASSKARARKASDAAAT